LFANLDVLDHLVDMWQTHNFEAGQHQHQFEMRQLLLGLLDDLIDDVQLSEQAHRLPIIVKQHARDVS